MNDSEFFLHFCFLADSLMCIFFFGKCIIAKKVEKSDWDWVHICQEYKCWSTSSIHPTVDVYLKWIFTWNSYLAKSSFSNRTSSSAVHWSDNVVKPQISANNILWNMNTELKLKSNKLFSHTHGDRNRLHAEFKAMNINWREKRNFINHKIVFICRR